MKEKRNQHEEISIVKNDLLVDSSLESLGLIKQLDTLAIVERVEAAEYQKRIKLQDALYALLGSLIIVLQVIMYYSLGIKITLLIDFVLSSPAPALILFNMSKKYKGGFINDFR